MSDFSKLMEYYLSGGTDVPPDMPFTKTQPSPPSPAWDAPVEPPAHAAPPPPPAHHEEAPRGRR